MIYSWVAKFLPGSFKDRLQSERRAFIRRRTGINKLLDSPEDVLTIRAYGNANFVNIIVKKSFYEQVEEAAKRLETTPDIFVYNALLLTLKNLEGACVNKTGSACMQFSLAISVALACRVPFSFC